MAGRAAMREASFWLAVALVSVSASVLLKIVAARLPAHPAADSFREFAASS